MSTLKVNSITPVTAGSEDYFLARAWVNFKGTGTVAINNSGNISSITDGGVGYYQLNITNAMATINYSAVPAGVSATPTEVSRIVAIRGSIGSSVYGKSTTALNLVSGYGWSSGTQDCYNISCNMVE